MKPREFWISKTGRPDSESDGKAYSCYDSNFRINKDDFYHVTEIDDALKLVKRLKAALEYSIGPTRDRKNWIIEPVIAEAAQFINEFETAPEAGAKE